MGNIKNSFTRDELNIIKLSLNKEITFLSSSINNIINSNNDIEKLRERQDKIETIISKVNDLILLNTDSMYSENDLIKGLLNNFEQID